MANMYNGTHAAKGMHLIFPIAFINGVIFFYFFLLLSRSELQASVLDLTGNLFLSLWTFHFILF